MTVYEVRQGAGGAGGSLPTYAPPLKLPSPATCLTSIRARIEKRSQSGRLIPHGVALSGTRPFWTAAMVGNLAATAG
jgi:hypothetical protein